MSREFDPRHNFKMLPFGELPRVPGTRAQVQSYWMHAFERARCEVTKDGENRLSVRLPAFDDALLSGESPAAPLQRWFRDQMTVTIDDEGRARFRLEYLNAPALVIHLGICLLFAVDLGFGGGATSAELSALAMLFVIAQFVSFAWGLAGFAIARRALVRSD